jgi:transposase
LANYLNRTFPGGRYHSVYEAGYCGFWIHEALCGYGINNMVTNPADVPTKDKERKQKNNRVDSRKLARSLRSGELQAIYVPGRIHLERRALLRARRTAAKEQTRYQNRVKGFLSFFGIQIPSQFGEGRWSGSFIEWIENIPMQDPNGQAALLFYLYELKHYRRRLAELNRAIRQLAGSEQFKEIVKLLTTIPGIGLLTAMIFLLEIVDITRFQNLDKLASFFGLIPGENSSGDDDDINHTGITPRKHSYLRAMLIEAAWIAARKDPALTMCYKQLTKRMSGKKAIIRIARKLLSRISYVLKNQKPYVTAVVQ